MVPMLEFGLKTIGWFDVWSFSHLISGVSVGFAVRQRNHAEIGHLLGVVGHKLHSLRFDLLGVLFLAYVWETLEHYLEVGLAGLSVEHWFQGVEFSGNRLLADPGLMLLGYVVARRFPRTVWPARITSIVWLGFHIFIFPDSMYLQGFITQSLVIDQILTHLRTRASTAVHTGARSPPSSRAPSAGAANRSLSTPGPHRDRTAGGPRAAPAGQRARDRPPAGVRAVDDHAIYSIDRD